MNKNELHTDKITKGKRTYFFDIKKSEQGDLYLTISENKKTENSSEHHRVMIFEEDLKDFVDTFRNSLLKFKELVTLPIFGLASGRFFKYYNPLEKLAKYGISNYMT